MARPTHSPDPTPPPAGDVALLIDGALTIDGACEAFGVSRDAIYDAMRDGVLPYVQRGTRRLIPRRALAAWLARDLVPAMKGG